MTLRRATQRLLPNILARPAVRTYATARRRIQIPTSYPTVESIPLSQCECQPMPEGLDIDHKNPLDGTMAAYAEHVLISTGHNTWKSRIEDDEDAPTAKQMKSLLTRGGIYMDPFHNVMITNSSFPCDADSTSAYLLPSFKHISSIPKSKDATERFIKGFVLPQTLHSAHDGLSLEKQEVLKRNPSLQSDFAVRDVDEILVLICGHGNRDERCGLLGPLLEAEFKRFLTKEDFDVPKDAQVGQISHIGGHKYAGNVIIYIPPSFADNSLAGKGIWYGRVTPKHVEGIVKTTIQEGKIIKDLFRGGIDKDRKIIRL